MELKYNDLHKELVAVYKRVKATDSLQAVLKVHDSLFTLETRLTKLEHFLWDAEQWYKSIFDSIEEKAYQVKEYQKYVEAPKALQDEVASLRRLIYLSL